MLLFKLLFLITKEKTANGQLLIKYTKKHILHTKCSNSDSFTNMSSKNIPLYVRLYSELEE